MAEWGATTFPWKEKHFSTFPLRAHDNNNGVYKLFGPVVLTTRLGPFFCSDLQLILDYSRIIELFLSYENWMWIKSESVL